MRDVSGFTIIYIVLWFIAFPFMYRIDATWYVRWLVICPLASVAYYGFVRKIIEHNQ